MEILEMLIMVAGSSIGTAFVTVTVLGRKYRADVRQIETKAETTMLGNVQLYVDAHRALLEGMREQLARNTQTNEELTQANMDLATSNRDLRQSNEEMREALRRLEESHAQICEDLALMKQQYPCKNCPARNNQNIL